MTTEAKNSISDIEDECRKFIARELWYAVTHEIRLRRRVFPRGVKSWDELDNALNEIREGKFKIIKK